MKKNISFEKKITFPTMIGEISAIDLEESLKFIDESNIEGEFLVKGKYKLTEASRLEEDFSYKIPAEIVLSEKLDLSTTSIEIVDFYYEIENDDTMICYIEVKVEGVEKVEVAEELVRNQESQYLTENAERECDGDVKTEVEKEIPHKNKSKENETNGDVNKKSEEEMMRKESEEILKNEALNLDENEKGISSQDNLNFDDNSEEAEIIEAKTAETDIDSSSEEVESLSNIFSSLSEKEETFSTYSVYILREDETVNTIIEKYKTTKEELEKYNDLTTLTKGSKIIVPLVDND